MDNQILKLHESGVKVKDIAQQFSISRKAVRDILKKYGIDTSRKRIYQIDESFLDQIDSEEKAYFLGWMWSDGCVSTRDNVFIIGLAAIDIEILEKMAKFFSSAKMVKCYKRNGYRCGSKAVLSIYSKKLKNRLIELGCMPNKTFKIKFPEWLDPKLYPHFIRGLFDGDGCLYVGKNTSRIILLGTESLVKRVQEVVQEAILVESKIDKVGNIYRLIIGTYDKIFEFLNFIYGPANIYLQRKREKYLQFIESYQQHKIYLNEKYLNSEDKRKILELYLIGMPKSHIAKIVKYSRNTIIRVLKNVDSSLIQIDKKAITIQYNSSGLFVKQPKKIVLEKTCKTCQVNKKIDQFRKRTKNDRIYYQSYCLECEKKSCKARYSKESRRDYYTRNKDKIKQYNDKWRQENKEWILSYREKNKSKINEYSRLWAKDKRNSDSSFKLRSIVSNSIVKLLKKSDGSKMGKSCFDHLSFTLEELKIHLEVQFEPWMNWSNHGKYVKNKWNENDSSTWKWQIDHVIPCSDLPFSSMEEENFKKCWSLGNLRPLSAKQNLMDGTKRVRHSANNRVLL